MKKALYRAYRPQTFDAVLGQDHITRVLKNQVQSRTPAHAYLFAGTRGTGKTSCAKILARAVNCLHPVNGNPCNECENCRAILEETTMDVVEMDAASNRRIDDIRELRDNVIYPPTLLKYKVYIIDEAHMITNEGFNALLKIMEEPPEHLIFILATTEMERIPVTILSRTQRYEFKRLELADIEKEVQYVAGEVGLDIYPDALHSIAIAADGAMRDALSLLDQVLASGKTTITQEIVDAVLGTVGYRSLTTLTQAVLADDLPAAFQQVEALLQNGKDAHILLKEWLEYWRLLLLIKGGGASLPLPLDADQRGDMRAMVAPVSISRLLQATQQLIETELWMRKSDFSSVLLEAGIAQLISYSEEASDSPGEKKQIRENDDGKPTSSAPGFTVSESASCEATASEGAEPELKEPIRKKMPAPQKAAQKNSIQAKEETRAEAVTEKKPDAEDPEQNPELWLRRHHAEISEMVIQRALFPPAFMGKYERVIFRRDHFVFIYPEDSIVRSVIEKHASDLSEIYSEIAGKRIFVEFQGTGDMPSADGRDRIPRDGAETPADLKTGSSEVTSSRAYRNRDFGAGEQKPASDSEDEALQLLKEKIPQRLLEIRKK
ncbi:MAG: DNA polymerase III subunit gamma/tau [Peptoniphilaceae bacterium]|nr:DNA polymerase III subunit gamma/tau [Peptoniphilaceae bacterium]